MDREAHVLFFLRHVRKLPEPYAGQDHHRVVLLFFCIHGLAILGELDRVDKKELIEWVYSLQVHPDRRDRSINVADCGFRGSPWMGNVFGQRPKDYESSTYDVAHIASTYASIAILRTLGDNLSRVNKQAVTASLRHLQNPATGGFSASSLGTEEDLRFVFCACAISHMLNDWSGVDRDGVVRYVNACATYEGGLGMNPGLEAQGGVTYCGMASLALCGRLAQVDFSIQKLLRWLVSRQQGGFQGRTNKTPDSCYAFWDGATLQMLGFHNLVDIPSVRKFVLSCQFAHGGGIAKFPDTYPDVMHAYYSLAWLSIAGEHGLLPLETKLQVPLPKKPSHK
ncbi:hypothetical protein SDRG_10950 [Saprolegnia diclina VS20]|uniref:Prenyltransferase alpha-alpha toroid domain-containing protein n=1 Tax=Saprolegnia diclina (strain VS20) TaxID=1156394 RepID=T0RGD9_SAPDV|nr:hypothetical protein SDRG_10950 [Saprolegnia diclina VS20]EQC31348.1 hypothetical protein SDRG_10950 [Saprolegnia diclina VS20]|eukprot:XP_008615189.1 hypothetical protein SDRG_10950 [Saprolegnia diclina VS20]